MDLLEHTYADLQPLKILDDDGDECQVSKVKANKSTEGPALTPVKEDVLPRDLRSYFKGKLMFDEPDDPPIIEVPQPIPRDDLFVLKKQPRKVAKLPGRTGNKQQVKSSPRKKQLRPLKNPERTIPCEKCNRKFVTLRHMRIHAVTHSRKRKQSCRLCYRKFGNEGALANHMRSHKRPRREI